MPPPFPGDSDEVHAIVRYMASTGVQHVVTSTTNHGQHTSTGNTSRHVQPGTHGHGLAVDFAERIGGGRDTKGLLAIRNALIPIQSRCFEIIYAGPGHPDNIKRGHPYAYPKVVMDGHHDHVHVSVDRGVFLEPAQHSTPAGGISVGPTFEVDMNITDIELTIPTPSGDGWAHVDYPIDKVLSVIGPGLRPDADGRVLTAKVGAAADGARTQISVQGWDHGSAVVHVRVAT